MVDHNGKYLRLFGTIFFTVIGFLLAIVLLLLGFRLLFGLLNYVPWLLYIYMLCFLFLPAALFVPAYLVYFKRTLTHPNKPVRWFSLAVFSIAIASLLFFLTKDLFRFFNHPDFEIWNYSSYDKVFLVANVACFFITGVIQALTTEKEKDWHERSGIK